MSAAGRESKWVLGINAVKGAAHRNMHANALMAHGMPGRGANAFGKRHLESVPRQIAFAAKGEGRKTDGQSGKGGESPKNANHKKPEKEGWLLWSPQGIYHFLDDMAYKGVEAGFAKLNAFAKMLGKKKDISRSKAAITAIAAGHAVDLAIKPVEDGGMAWGVDWGNVPGAVFALFMFGVGAAAWQILENAAAQEDAGAIKGMNEGQDFFRCLRFPFMIFASAAFAVAAFSESALALLDDGARYLGVSVFLYLLSNENGTGKKMKDALKQFVERIKAGLARKSQVGSGKG
jgi:hypothetical protein